MRAAALQSLLNVEASQVLPAADGMIEVKLRATDAARDKLSVSRGKTISLVRDTRCPAAERKASKLLFALLNIVPGLVRGVASTRSDP
jgi:hypothetical protein